MHRFWSALVLAGCLAASAQTTTTFESDGWVVSVEVSTGDVQVADFTGSEIDALDDDLLLHVAMSESSAGASVLYPCRVGEVRRYLESEETGLSGGAAARNVALFRQLHDHLQ